MGIEVMEQENETKDVSFIDQTAQRRLAETYLVFTIFRMLPMLIH
ncbi:unnamed protein product [Camellia sinensis]